MKIQLLATAILALGAVGAAGTEPGPDCAKCHRKLQERPFTHGPVGVGMCGVCHVDEKADAAKTHRFSLAKPEPELCLSCHDSLRTVLKSSPHKHPAVSRCSACHDPHGAEQRYLFRAAAMDKICSSCHKSVTKGAVVHAPAANSCALCHDLHGSTEAKLLKNTGSLLCLDCHRDRLSEFESRYIHGPALAGCTSCHDPHSAPKAGLLQVDGRKELCLGCHDEMGKRLKALRRPHLALSVGGCVACHTPHTSSQKMLLKGPLKELCVSCHKEKAEELKSAFLHGPVAMNQCQGCHEPHGTDNPRLLTDFFPEDFYTSYKDGLYALCFKCHEPEIARDPETTTLTDFRDGKKNLHHLHVNSVKGRSCKACHQVHASNQRKHVREKVPFGSWMLPIAFKKLPDGGGCTVGCHNPKTYSRTLKEKP